MSKKAEVAPPEWSLKIEGVRRGRKLSQSDFGIQLGVSAMTVSRWERGAAEPPGGTYIRLGNIAGDPLCWFFWKRAGLRLSDVTRVLPGARRRFAATRLPLVNMVHAGTGRKNSLKNANLVAIPLLPVQAGTPGSQGDNVDLAEVTPENVMAAPIGWCPNPASTMCLRVKGNSMSPLILDGYIIAVDTSDVEKDSLVGQIVVASHKEKGLLVSRLIRFDHMDVLVSDQREYGSVPVTAGSEWRIVGKVLWWTGRAR
jgi:SOS-response transcriptional repressor LexA/DNA-binding XRE family transcriptional regulator